MRTPNRINADSMFAAYYRHAHGASLPRLAALSIAALLACSALASSTALSPAPGSTGYQFGWRVVDVFDVPVEQLVNEPDYSGGRPYYFALRLGNGPDPVVTAVMDDTNPDTLGYETMYVDVNNNNDLTDDKPIKPGITQDGLATAYDVPPVNVLIKYADGTSRELKAAIEVFANHRKRSGTWWSVGCQLDQHLEGRVNAGERKNLLIAVYDSTYNDTPSNGCFDDFCTDRIRLDLNGDGDLCADTEDFPLSRVLRLDGRLWAVSLDSGGSRFQIKPFKGPTGKAGFDLNVSNDARLSGGTIEVTSPALGYSFSCPANEASELVLPVGSYRISRAMVYMKDAEGVNWEAVFSTPEAFSVTSGKDSNVAISSFGAPFEIEPRVRGRLKAGRNVCVWPYIAGSGGELYQNISRVKTRMIPELEVVDSQDITVVEAKMEYG